MPLTPRPISHLPGIPPPSSPSSSPFLSLASHPPKGNSRRPDFQPAIPTLEVALSPFHHSPEHSTLHLTTVPCSTPADASTRRKPPPHPVLGTIITPSSIALARVCAWSHCFGRDVVAPTEPQRLPKPRQLPPTVPSDRPPDDNPIQNPRRLERRPLSRTIASPRRGPRRSMARAPR